MERAATTFSYRNGPCKQDHELSPSAPLLNSNADRVSGLKKYLIRMLSVMADRNCTGYVPKIVVQSLEK